jgi:hypothetical protein
MISDLKDDLTALKIQREPERYTIWRALGWLVLPAIRAARLPIASALREL